MKPSTRKQVNQPSIAGAIGVSVMLAFLPSAFADDAFSAADIITGATPHALGTPRVSHLDRFVNPDCTSCHGDVHLSGFKSPSCTSCHGPVGAPTRPPELRGRKDHPDGSCTRCHEESHAALSFESPSDCRACHRYQPRGRRCTRFEDYDVVVVGAGGGGLAAAAQLASSGVSVVLLEQHFRLGGAMNNFERHDYRFETSLHTTPGHILAYFEQLGIENEVVPIVDDIMYRIALPGFEMDIPPQIDAYQASLESRFPDDAEKIEALFDGFNTMDLATYGGMTVQDVLDFHGIENKQLIAVLTVLVKFLVVDGIDATPIEQFLPMWYSFHHLGYLYIEGGSQAIVDALEQTIQHAGGTIKRNARVTKVFVHRNRVRGAQTSDGVCYTSRFVVSNANAKSTFLQLVGRRHLPRDMVREVVSRRPADSPAATLFLGVDHDYTGHFPEGTHTIFLTEDIGMQGADWQRTMCLPEQIMMIVQNYTAADPGTAPAGKNAIVATAHLLNYQCNDYWNWYRSYDDYRFYKSELATVLIDRLETILPDLSEHIEVMEMLSPHTVRHFTLNPGGSWAGWAAEPDKAFVYTDQIETPVSGLYIVGAWSGASGQSGALKSGIDAAAMILEDIGAPTTSPEPGCER